jgi:hypothetical protein
VRVGNTAGRPGHNETYRLAPLRACCLQLPVYPLLRQTRGGVSKWGFGHVDRTITGGFFRLKCPPIKVLVLISTRYISYKITGLYYNLVRVNVIFSSYIRKFRGIWCKVIYDQRPPHSYVYGENNCAFSHPFHPIPCEFPYI